MCLDVYTGSRWSFSSVSIAIVIKSSSSMHVSTLQLHHNSNPGRSGSLGGGHQPIGVPYYSGNEASSSRSLAERSTGRGVTMFLPPEQNPATEISFLASRPQAGKLDISFASSASALRSSYIPLPPNQRMEEIGESMLFSQLALNVGVPGVAEGDPTLASASDASAQRQMFLIEQRKIQRALHWRSIIEATRFVKSIVSGMRRSKAQARAREKMSPVALLGIRRAVRRARLALVAPTMTRPTVAAIRNDKMLGLFSEAHIEYLAEKLAPKYYFPGEAIIFLGCEEDECYVLHSGKADVLMGKIKVFTMTAGMVFGSVGMITGEPRTATIIAREQCFVWAIRRKVFESYGARDHQVAAAQTIIRELRQKNIRSVYKGMFEPEYLMSKFSILAGVTYETVNLLLTKGEPRVLKHGEVLLHPPEVAAAYLSSAPDSGEGGSAPSQLRAVGHESNNDIVFVLRGKVRVARDKASEMSSDKCVEEHLMFLIELVNKRTATDDIDILSRMARDLDSNLSQGGALASQTTHPQDPSSGQILSRPDATHQQRAQGSRHMIGELSGPMLLNVAPLVLGEPSPLIVETVGGCDILVISKELLSRLPQHDQATLRQNSVNLHCPFIKPLSRSALLRTIFNNSLSFDFLSRLQTGTIRQVPYVYYPGTKLKFGIDPNRPSYHYGGRSSEHPFVALLVLKGDLVPLNDNRNRSVSLKPPLLWPDVTLTLFGCELCEAVCATRVEAIRLQRSDIIETLLNALDEGQLETFCSALTTSFVARVGRRPVMELSGIHPTKGVSQARWKHLIAVSKESARASRPVHVVQKSGAAPNAARRRSSAHEGGDVNQTDELLGDQADGVGEQAASGGQRHQSFFRALDNLRVGDVVSGELGVGGRYDLAAPQRKGRPTGIGGDMAAFLQSQQKQVTSVSVDSGDDQIARNEALLKAEFAFIEQMLIKDRQKEIADQAAQAKVQEALDSARQLLAAETISPTRLRPVSARQTSSLHPRKPTSPRRPVSAAQRALAPPPSHRLSPSRSCPRHPSGSLRQRIVVDRATQAAVVAQNASSGVMVMKYGPSRVGVRQVDRLRQELEEFFA